MAFEKKQSQRAKANPCIMCQHLLLRECVACTSLREVCRSGIVETCQAEKIQQAHCAHCACACTSLSSLSLCTGSGCSSAHVLLIFIFKLPSETKQSHKTNVQQPILQAKSKLRCVVFVGHKQHYALSNNNQQQLQPQSQTSQAQGQLHLHCFCIFNLITTNWTDGNCMQSPWTYGKPECGTWNLNL
jgi:hypothetical protein